jgi:hypothetical protein
LALEIMREDRCAGDDPVQHQVERDVLQWRELLFEDLAHCVGAGLRGVSWPDASSIERSLEDLDQAGAGDVRAVDVVVRPPVCQRDG